MKQRSLAVDFDDPRRARLGDHHPAIFERLKGVDLDGFALVPVRRRRVVGPDGLFRFRIDLDDFLHSILDHNMPAGQNVNIVNSTPFHFPFDVSIGGDDGELFVALHEDSMSRFAVVRRRDKERDKYCDIEENE